MNNVLKSCDDEFKEKNDFENICKNNVKNPNNTHQPFQGFLKITQNGQSDVYNDKGNRLSYKNKQEMYEEICLRT